MAHRSVSDAGDFHGSARHFSCQCRTATHRGKSFSEYRRVNLGSDQLPRLKRHYPAGHELAGSLLWAQTFPDILHHYLHSIVGAVRCGREPGYVAFCTSIATCGRWCAETDRSGGTTRKFPGGETRFSDGSLWTWRCRCSDYWTNTWRLDH